MYSPVNYVVALLLLGMLTGCGQRPGMASGDDGGAQQGDAHVGPNDCYPRPDGALAPCSEVRFSACTGLPTPVITGTAVQDPHVAWTGWEFLTVHWNTDSFEGRDLVLTSIAPDGEVLFTEELEGYSTSQVGWHNELNSGVVTTDSGVQWLDGCGRPYGEVMRIEFLINNGSIGWYAAPAATIFPVPQGLMMVTGFDGWSEPAESNPPLSYTLLGPAPAEVAWTALQEPGPWARPRHVTGADGGGRWVVASHWTGTQGALFRVEGTAVQHELDLDDILPPGADGFILDMVEASGELYVLFTGTSANGQHGQWIVQITSPEARTWSFLDQNFSLDGMFTLGDEIIVTLLDFNGSGDLSLARFDPDSATEPLADAIQVGDWSIGWSTSTTPTERGFALVWAESSQLNLQAFDCCADTTE